MALMVDYQRWVGGLPWFGGRDQTLWWMMQEGEKGFNPGLGLTGVYRVLGTDTDTDTDNHWLAG